MENISEVVNKNLIFDSHAHYDSDKFSNDRDEILEFVHKNGVCGIVNAASNLDSAEESIKLAERYPYVWAAAGIHPHDMAESVKNPDWQTRLKALLSHKRVVAVGEIGLDFHYDFSPRDVQREGFIAQLKIANELDMPVIIHEREAGRNVWEILEEYTPKGVVHAFSGSVETARELIKRGMYIGVGGVLTFSNARKIVEVVEDIPLESILLETDAPYLTPAPFRGKRNDSSKIIHVAEKMAEIKGVSVTQVLTVTRKNAMRLFKIDLVNFETNQL